MNLLLFIMLPIWGPCFLLGCVWYFAKKGFEAGPLIMAYLNEISKGKE